MKPSGRIIRHKLFIEEEQGDRFVGLVSSEADYKISLLINNKLNIKLKSNKPVSLASGEGTEILFTRFTAASKFNDLTFDLVSNKSDNVYLTKKYPNLDYVLKINGSVLKETFSEIINKIRSIDGIIAVFILEDKLQLEDNILEIIA